MWLDQLRLCSLLPHTPFLPSSLFNSPTRSPSWLASMDDWYMTNGTSQLAVIETSHDINNQSLYDKLTPSSVLCW
jgi:hypothetical protein